MTVIEIYVGSLIQHGSDRAVFESVIEHLSAKQWPAIVLANVNLSGRQIDLVVALGHSVIVLEAKGNSTSVRGDVNGPWEVRVASGVWKKIPNLYGQAVDASYAFRDAMRQFSGAEVAYPSAALVFTPAIPPGSSVDCGDFKAAVIGLDQIDRLLHDKLDNTWSLDQWRAFARHHNLQQVQTPQAAFNPKLSEAEQLLDRYESAFRRTYAPRVANMVPFECRHTGGLRPSDELIARAANGADLLLKGQSGCGKTLMAFSIGLDCMDRGRVPILISGKDFEGKLRDVVHREAVLLDVPSAETLVAACRRLGRPLLFLVDGYNECLASRRATFTRSVAVAARRHEATVVVTTQIELEHSQLLLLSEVAILSPTNEIKKAIGLLASGDPGLNASLDSLYNSVTTGLEARLIGEVSRTIPPDASRYSLFDFYVRKRLGDAASEGIGVLARFAGLMSERISFSLTVRDCDRFVDREGISIDTLRCLQASNLFVERGGRASFSHELFLDAFAAEAVIRRAGDDPSAIERALRSTQHAGRKALIVGAIDDDALRARVLSDVDDASIIRDCVAGHCGPSARAWAKRRCEEIIKRVGEEAAQLVFEVSEDGFMGIRADPARLFAWSRQDRAVLDALPGSIVDGHYLDDVLGIAAIMDQVLAREHSRLLERVRDKQIALRSALFANCYTWRGMEPPGVAIISSPLHSGTVHGPRISPLSAQVRERLIRKDLSHGQLYLLLALDRNAALDGPSVAPQLSLVLGRLWQWSPYHLRLELMHAARGAAYRATETDRQTLIQTIERLPETQNVIVSTAIIDALKALGALDESEAEHTDVVRDNIREIFADQSNPDMQALAYGVWYGQFDHPYDGAYCQAVSELSLEKHKTLLTLAGKGAGLESPFASILIKELAATGDPATSPVIGRWIKLPPVRCAMRQDAIGNFALAHIAMGRLGCVLPALEGKYDSDGARTLAACGEILYWMNRIDLPNTQRRAACTDALAVLTRHELGLAGAIISEFSNGHTMWSEGLARLPGTERVYFSIGELFPAETLQIYRECLRNPTLQRGYFDWLDQNLAFGCAVAALDEWGDTTDISVLRVWSILPSTARQALTAIRKLEETEMLSARA
jgi:hypothetical protein